MEGSGQDTRKTKTPGLATKSKKPLEPARRTFYRDKSSLKHASDDKSNNDKSDFVKRMMDAFGIDPMKCPVCGSRMLRQKSIPRQQPPIQTRSPP